MITMPYFSLPSWAASGLDRRLPELGVRKSRDNVGVSAAKASETDDADFQHGVLLLVG